MCFVQYYTQKELILVYLPAYLYEAVILLKSMVSIRLTAVKLKV
jgi:hypothetical protein